jgi:hypothetical protein
LQSIAVGDAYPHTAIAGVAFVPGHIRVLRSHNGLAATMIEEFRKATEFHYFGIDNGLLDTGKSTRRRLLKDYAHRAYRGCV